jgi:cytosine/adenosine deaminase-related metal-dependent hydrolase
MPGAKRVAASFVDWIDAVIRAPRPSFETLLGAARAMTASGVTAVGNHDSAGVGARLLRRLRLGGVNYRELLAFDPAAARAVARSVAAVSREDAIPGSFLPGIAPHAPYTVAQAALDAVRSSRLRVSVHLAETPEEVLWIRRGTGPLESLLRARGRRPGLPVPRAGAVAWLERAGLLTARTAVVHANHLTVRELGRLSSAGCVAVHCPGTHAFFHRGAPPVRAWIRSGVRFALGTDSLASNDTLDLFHEMARLRRSDASIDARAIVEAATVGGARALGLRGAGTLRPAARADFVLLDVGVSSHRPDRFLLGDLDDALVDRPKVAGVVRAS